MPGAGESVRILRSVPIGREGLEGMVQIVNAINDCLSEHGVWAEVIGEEDMAHFVLFSLNPLNPEAPPRDGTPYP